MDDYFGYSIKFGEIFEGNGFRRELAVVSNAASPKLPSSWKASLWERSSIEPAILRYVYPPFSFTAVFKALPS